VADTPCDPKDVALAALTNLVRLMGAELVAGKHRDDVGFLEQAVRSKMGTLTVDGCAPEVAEAGLALAKTHAESALIQIRSQAAAAHVHNLEAALRTQGSSVPQSATPMLH